MIPTFRPWTHTSDDSYIYQLSLVVATATVSYIPVVGHCQALHLPCLPVVPVASRRLSWKLPWIAVATTVIAGKLPSINVGIQLPRNTVEIALDFRGNCRVSEDCRGWRNAVV